MTHEAEITETKTPRPRMKISAILIVVGIAVAAVLIVGWLLLRTRSQSTTGLSDKTSQTPTILVSHVVSKDVDRELKVPGELRAYQDVAIYPKVQGFVETINVDRGSVVMRGVSMGDLVEVVSLHYAGDDTQLRQAFSCIL